MDDRGARTFKTTPRAGQAWDSSRLWIHWEVKPAARGGAEEQYVVSKVVEQGGEPHCVMSFRLTRGELQELVAHFGELVGRT